MRSRLLTSALWCTVLGAILQTLVAWLLMLYVPVQMDPYKSLKTEPPGSYARLSPVEWGPPSRCFALPDGIGTHYYQIHWGESADPRHMLHQYECGVPFRSFTGGSCGDFPIDNPRGVTWDAALLPTPAWTHPPQWMWASDTRYTCQIVYLPLWRGFALNTGVFATLLWVSQACFIAVRRSRRRAASRCERCGYPLDRLAKCPECGPVRD